ncbi:hypothetical protein PENTCL1PPCAC_19737 [Pristionchus entomophagus]|uniref:Uncharacterized protein n=1 Tax=Pristionchus entomophagus TaxID=358040 RepID=A0AAV5TTP7_9BILA|nr:hypothetical protein PENTCL1PPCAC_19737 [Pristionchus entomophagus]
MKLALVCLTLAIGVEMWPNDRRCCSAPLVVPGGGHGFLTSGFGPCQLFANFVCKPLHNQVGPRSGKSKIIINRLTPIATGENGTDTHAHLICNSFNKKWYFDGRIVNNIQCN